MKELFFTETKSHIFLIFVIHARAPHFIISITLLRAKTMTLYLCAKLCKKYDLNSILMRNFVQKNYLFLNERAISCKTGFLLIRNRCEISCKNTRLFHKRIYCFVETLIMEVKKLPIITITK